MSVLVVVGLGLLGGVGATARFLLDGAVSSRLGRSFPWGTFDGVARLEWLLKVGRALTSELDLPTVLDQILEQPSMEIATAVGSDTDLPRIL